MLATVEGIYENGHIVLEENAPVPYKSKVLVTFIEELPTKTRKLGSWEGQYQIPDDFNDPIDDLQDYM